MKKFALTILSFVLLVIVNKAYAAPGDVAGNIYSTDIVAYIDGLAVESYNIGGKTVVIAEELEPYGFEVIWDAENRTISVYTKGMPETVPEYTPIKSKVSGRIAGNIYETDIKAYVNGMWVESYNIGGRTALVIEDMASEDDNAKRMSRDGNPHRAMGYSVSLMKAVWNNAERTISLNCIRPGNRIMTDYGEVMVSDVSVKGYSTGAYSFYTEDDEEIIWWVNIILTGDETYVSLRDFSGNVPEFYTYQSEDNEAVFENLSAKINETGFSVNIPEDNIRNVVYTNASTIGSCYNMLITISDDLIINGVASDTETADLVLYGGNIYIGINAINSALRKKAVSYKYELPENCKEHIDDVRESHVVVYINDNHINSFNTSDGSCYVSAKDLKEHGFKVEIDGYTCNILSPEKAVTLEQEKEYPETREYGEVDESLTLYPIYNGVYDVTVDGKPIEDVYIMTTLIYRSPCISVQELASIAGYKTDTSEPFKVKIYTE